MRANTPVSVSLLFSRCLRKSAIRFSCSPSLTVICRAAIVRGSVIVNINNDGGGGGGEAYFIRAKFSPNVQPSVDRPVPRSAVGIAATQVTRLMKLEYIYTQ